MTPLNDVLKPKSKCEISDNINKMNLYHFLEKFKNYDLKGLKISFKKKFAHFMIYKYVKYHLKYYWMFWLIWIVLMFLKYFTKIHVIIIAKEIFGTLLGLSLIPLLISIIIQKRLRKWVRKNIEDAITNFQFLATQEIFNQNYVDPETVRERLIENAGIIRDIIEGNTQNVDDIRIQLNNFINNNLNIEETEETL